MAPFIIKLVSSKILMSCVLSFLLAKLLKVVILLMQTGKFERKYLFTSGAMPSVHAASVAALTTAIFFEEGVTPLSIAVLIFSIIIVRDAVGIRWTAGQQSIVINRMIEYLRKQGKFKLDKLEEVMGHTLSEVVVGSVIGILITSSIYLVI
ncbi:divergent PAP2 family protein [Candidatus Woesearchaeota archaeon]|nr:divergent PAP2 family protein [Candidatus Woesearchaeota archaeon]